MFLIDYADYFHTYGNIKMAMDATQEALKVAINVSAIWHYEKYLGLPSFIGRNKKVCFTQIKERIWAQMQG